LPVPSQLLCVKCKFVLNFIPAGWRWTCNQQLLSSTFVIDQLMCLTCFLFLKWNFVYCRKPFHCHNFLRIILLAIFCLYKWKIFLRRCDFKAVSFSHCVVCSFSFILLIWNDTWGELCLQEVIKIKLYVNSVHTMFFRSCYWNCVSWLTKVSLIFFIY